MHVVQYTYLQPFAIKHRKRAQYRCAAKHFSFGFWLFALCFWLLASLWPLAFGYWVLAFVFLAFSFFGPWLLALASLNFILNY
jgi:Flp pilus assembly protein TadB